MSTPEDDSLSALIRREATRHAPPTGLAERIASDLRAATPSAAATTPPPRPRAGRRWLVYREREHVINLFVWPAPASTPSTQTRQGFSLAAWTQGGMQFWAVSDASPQDLQGFAQALRTRIDAAANTP